MKTKLVIWGENQNDEKILLAIELVPNENKVQIYAFPENQVTELFYNRMINEWRMGKPLDFPETYETFDSELTASDDLLPEGIKVQRTDLIARAKTEWHFIVLSAKLYEIYHSELDDFKMRIDQLSKFDEGLWEEMKGFWDKVQKQVREKNLFREHVFELRTITNQLFDRLKSLRRSLDEEFKTASKEVAGKILSQIEDIEKKANEGLGLQPLFEKLKSVQKEFNTAKLARKDRSKVWNKLDKTFKIIKEKKFGSRGEGSSNLDRITRRYEGLNSAIARMQKSIDRDHADKRFQDERIETTDGQLEQQIRQAKIKMIEERIKSKQMKLDDMNKTKVELEKKIEKEKERMALREEKQKKKEIEKEVKEKIATEIKDATESRKEDDAKLKEAAEQIKESASKESKQTPPVVDKKEIKEETKQAPQEPVKEPIEKETEKSEASTTEKDKASSEEE